jgi:hypothetical protein
MDALLPGTAELDLSAVTRTDGQILGTLIPERVWPERPSRACCIERVLPSGKPQHKTPRLVGLCGKRLTVSDCFHENVGKASSPGIGTDHSVDDPERRTGLYGFDLRQNVSRLAHRTGVAAAVDDRSASGLIDVLCQEQHILSPYFPIEGGPSAAVFFPDFKRRAGVTSQELFHRETIKMAINIGVDHGVPTGPKCCDNDRSAIGVFRTNDTGLWDLAYGRTRRSDEGG